MSLDPDRMFDRRRLKLAVIVWRTIAILVLIVLVIVLIGRFGIGGLGEQRVARLWLDDVIVDDPEREAALAEIAVDRRVRALIVRIDSPGGTAEGGEALYHSLRRVAERKPVVAVMGATATSAAYMAALAADRIIAREATVTGSIGVILQTADITDLLATLGIKTEAIKSAPLKAQPSLLEPLSEEARAATRAVIADMYELFIDLVVTRRGLARETVRGLADGRIFSGRQAKAARLIDALGGEDEARKWLAETQAIPHDLPITDLERSDDVGLVGLIGEQLRQRLLPPRLRLDGAISVWQAEPAK